VRPFKHAAPTNATAQDFRYQDVLDISFTRFVTDSREIPIVVTSEIDRITVFSWNDQARQWDTIERPHAPLTRTATTLEAPTGWNWSRHVAVTSSADTLFVVYKRAQRPAEGGDTRLVIDRYRAGETGIELFDSTELPHTRQLQFGFSLWAGVDQKRQRLLILVQRGDRIGALGNFTFSLTLITLPLDDPASLAGRTSMQVGRGGYDLDARGGEGTLTAVYRESAAAIRFPPPLQGFEITSGPESDAFYEPLTLAQIDLDAMAVATETLPGGEHPQIQTLDPLIVTFDRQRSTSVRFDRLVPLPPARPRILWQPTQTDKIAFIRHTDGDARGVILATPASALPRALRRFCLVTHLIAPHEEAIGYSSPIDRFPVHVLALEPHDKGLIINVLHHRAFLGLLRTRLTTSIANGTVTVTDSVFEVWDIGHEQIGAPGLRVPDAEAENRQFRPLGFCASHRSEIAAAERLRIDNTIGGHLTADLQREPAGFFAYTDMGDGGLRVIYEQRVRPLTVPAPVADAKHLLPENVTGPGMPGEGWIQLDADDWVATEHPAYPMPFGRTTKSLGGAPEMPIELLREAVVAVNTERLASGEAQLDMVGGLSEDDLFAIDEFRAGQAADLTTDLTAADGSGIQITVSPGAPIERQVCEFSAVVDGDPDAAVTWTFVHLDSIGGPLPDGPIRPANVPPTFPPVSMVVFTNPVTVPLVMAGQWRVSVFHGPGAELAAGVFRDVTVADSTETVVWAVHRELSPEGPYRIGSVRLQMLQNVVTYTVPATGQRIVAFELLLARPTEMRFRGNDLEQGQIDCRTHVTVDSTDVALEGALGLAFVVTELHVDLHYQRPFTPGVLMADSRAFGPATGIDLEENPEQTIGRNVPLAHAGLSGKPIGDRQVTATPDVRVELTPGAVTVSAILAALTIVGATAAAASVVFLLELLAVAIALGVAGVALAVAVAVALAVFLVVIAPRIVSEYVNAQVRGQLESQAVTDVLDQQGLLRYGGEGLSEGIARQVLTRAIDEGRAIASLAESNDEERIGTERRRGQTFQMVFVSAGTCRVLVRDDE
jgi:hypothetical protein